MGVGLEGCVVGDVVGEWEDEGFGVVEEVYVVGVVLGEGVGVGEGKGGEEWGEGDE